MKLTNLFKSFWKSEKAGGLVLIVCTIVSLCIANASFGLGYTQFWHIFVAGQTVEYWINDGLMTVFFLLIGLELKREFYQGALASIKDALLPMIAAVGGMLVPAAVYILFNYNTATKAGAGIPMATDIAFALGILSLVSKRVPTSLKVFLITLAIIDDIGAIIIIAVFYSSTLLWANILIAMGVFGILILLNKLHCKNLVPYIAGGIAMWYCMLHSGVHPTITGVLLAFAIPFSTVEEKSPAHLLQSFLHKPVAFFILPLFALANTAIVLSPNFTEIMVKNYSIGIAIGLIIGKPLGIFIFSYLAVVTKFCKLPTDLNWKYIIGAGCLGGIGFTMSMFITLLAFDSPTIINHVKTIVLASSLIASILGYAIIKLALQKTKIQALVLDKE